MVGFIMKQSYSCNAVETTEDEKQTGFFSSAQADEPGISQYGEQAAIILVYAAITILSERASVFRREIMSNLVECR